jgi:hypothetical protein
LHLKTIFDTASKLAAHGLANATRQEGGMKKGAEAPLRALSRYQACDCR